MNTTTNAGKMIAVAGEPAAAAEGTEGTAIIGGVPTQHKPPKRRMAREPQAGAGAVESKVDDGNQAPSPAPRATSKIASVIALLERTEGATLPEMVDATGWLPHTTRAALTGLKKKGHTISKDKRGDVTCYRIAKAG